MSKKEILIELISMRVLVGAYIGDLVGVDIKKLSEGKMIAELKAREHEKFIDQ